MQLSTIYDSIEKLCNLSNQRTLIKNAAQWALEELCSSNSWPFLNTEGVINLIAPYETGTVEVTNGSKTVTGTDTVWTSAMVGRKIRFSDSNAYYRIAAVGGNTSLTLDSEYQGTTDTDATYSIFKDEYKLAPDVDVEKVMRQLDDSRVITGVPSLQFDMYQPSPKSEGTPHVRVSRGRERDTYTTGTVAASQGAHVITGTDTVWTSMEGLGRMSSIRIGNNVYTVKTVDSDTQITVYDSIIAAASGATYEATTDNIVVQFFNIPDEAEPVRYYYQRMPEKLINDYDTPDMPQNWHWVLVQGALEWVWQTKDSEAAINSKQRFRNSIEMMKKRIGQSGTSRTFRRGLDSVMFTPSVANYGSNYGIPISH